MLSIGLVAIAVANASFMESMGVYLADQVYAKHDELGSGWLLIQSPLADPLSPFLTSAGHVAKSLDQLATVRDVLLYRHTTHIQTGNDSANLDLIVLGSNYNLTKHPYIFVLYGSESIGTLFLKNDVTIRTGRFPHAPGEIALERSYAEGKSISTGMTVALRNDPFSSGAAPIGNFTITGLFDRVTRGNLAEGVPLVIASHDDLLEGFIKGRGLAHGFPSAVVLARLDLRDVPSGVGHVRDSVQAHGFSVSLAIPGWLDVPPEDAWQSTFSDEGDERVASEVIIYANGDLLTDALEAASRTTAWYRILGVSAALMASIGVAFVSTASAKRMRRETAVRQALGFPAWRLWYRSVCETLSVGAIGGLGGALLAAALVASGLASTLLGVAFTLKVPSVFLIGPVIGSILYTVSALPAYMIVLTCRPAENLRLSKE